MPPASIRKQLPSWQQESTAEGANSLLPYAPTSPIQRRSGPFVYRLGHLVFNQARGVRLPYGLPLTHFFTFLSIGFVVFVSNIGDRLDKFCSGFAP